VRLSRIGLYLLLAGIAMIPLIGLTGSVMAGGNLTSLGYVLLYIAIVGILGGGLLLLISFFRNLTSK
jgi:hypothetical protein